MPALTRRKHLNPPKDSHFFSPRCSPRYFSKLFGSFLNATKNPQSVSKTSLSSTLPSHPHHQRPPKKTKEKGKLTSVKKIITRNKQYRQRNNRRNPLPRRRIIPPLILPLRLLLLGFLRQPILLLREPSHARRSQRRVSRFGCS